MDLGRPKSVQRNTLPARTCPFLWLTFLWKRSKVSSCSRRKTVVGLPRAAMAESHRVGCRRILLCRLRWHPGQSAVASAPWQGLVWCFSSAVMHVSLFFCLFVCLCVTAVCNPEEQCWLTPGAPGHPGFCLIPMQPPRLLFAVLPLVTSFVCLFRVWVLCRGLGFLRCLYSA